MILLAGMLALLGLIGWLMAGPAGIGWFILAGALIMVTAPQISPRLILRLYGARVLLPEQAPQLYEIITWLAKQAEMERIPTLYYIPSKVMNAFSTGVKKDTAIAISDAMLRQLTTRELNGVLAHEISHIHSNDVLVMLVADVISRLTSVFAFTGYILIWVYIPLFIITDVSVPWVLLIILIMAPNLSALMQLALSRTREFNADVGAARITGDPMGLAFALEKIEYYQGSWFERVFTLNRRIPEPSLLRTHPVMAERINRLKILAEDMKQSTHPFHSGQIHNWTDFPPPGRSPGCRFPGLWY